MRRLGLCAVLVASIAGLACNAITEIGDYNYDAVTVAEGGGGSVPISCNEGFECVPDSNGRDLVRVMRGVASCPAGWGTAVPFGDGVDPGCPTCQCAAVTTTGTCELGTFRRWNTATCDASVSNTYSPDEDGDCSNTAGVSPGFEVPEGTASPALPCLAGDTDPVPRDDVTVCRLEDKTALAPCDAGVCVPRPANGFEAQCTEEIGSTSCGGTYANKLLVYGNVTDTRVCSCTCGDPDAACAKTLAVLYDTSACAGNVVGQLPVGCNDTTGFTPVSSIAFLSGTWTGGDCEPHGTTSGSVNYTNPTTLCCTAPP